MAQKYGIHLATRLQSDDPGRQANWADIDEDDDDWAPQSIEWSDGTKITMTQQVELPVPEPAKPVNVVVASTTEKPASPGPTMSSSMKLGGTGRGFILKGASEKPTLVAKPPAPPAPVKSPWAPLPPVDKVAPIVTELPSQQQHISRFAHRDPHGFDAMPPPPAKEIAADDFSRSWRDSSTGASRELYNSQSGRYEPVNDGRRGSRQDMHPRQPALLQRHQETQGPAEPSAAFQTHRANLQETTYGRRRTSSNVSGGSGIYGRRLSRGHEGYPPHDLQGARRGSLVAVSDEPSPRLHSPSGYPGQRSHPPQQWQSRASPVVSHASPMLAQSHLAHPLTPAIPLEDEVELQKKIMRESRELARKRRLEEEAREEAERKERIRLKLEAMGPPPEPKKSKKDIPKEEKAIPTQIQTREIAKPAGPPRPPVGDSAGEVKQYGMMKVHPPEPVRAPTVVAEPSSSQLNEAQMTDETRLHDIRSVAASHGGVEAQAPPSQPQSWQNNQPDSRFPNWASPGQHPGQGRNVWGPPTNDRTLGNGTFNPELSMQSSQTAQTGPGPIAPPNTNRPNGQYQGRPREHYAQRPAPIGPPSRQQEQRPAGTSAWTSSNIQSRIAEDDARIQAEQERLQTSRPGEPAAVIKDSWRQVTLTSEGHRGDVNAPAQKLIAGASAGPAPTWTDYPVRPRQDEASHYAGIEPGIGVQQAWPQGHMNEAPSTSAAPPPSRGSRFFPQGRDVQGRDVPRDVPVHEQLYARPGSPSPPPPTMADHPAYDGDAARPHVSLPRPPPVVKLPPAPVLAPIAPPKPASFAAAAAAAAAIPSGPSAASLSHYRAQIASPQNANAKAQISSAEAWQSRIDSLMGRRTSHPKSHSLAVDSSSKHALDHSISQIPATVSLPGISIPSEEQGTYETKPMAEECFEEQEMGYVPVVSVPRETPEHLRVLAAPQTKPLPKKFAVSDATTASSIAFQPQSTKDSETILILLPGMDADKRIGVVHKVEPRQKSNPRRPGQARGNAQRNSSTPFARGGRGRDASNAFTAATPDHGSPSTSPGSSAQRGGRGRGGFGNNWNHRHVSTPSSAINV